VRGGVGGIIFPAENASRHFQRMRIFSSIYTYMYTDDGVATMSRLLKIIGLFRRISSVL